MPNRRADGRTQNQHREIQISYDGLARADGSSRFSFGDISALASISGPIEVRLAAENPSKATFEVLVRPLSNVPATESKSLSTHIRSCLEPSILLTKFPRTLVQLVIQSLTSPPKTSIWRDTLSAAMVNASTLALLNAGSIPMRGVVVAIAIGQSADGSLLVDPDEVEGEALVAGGCFAFLFADGVGRDSDIDCVWANWKSKNASYSKADFLAAKELAIHGAQSVYDTMRKNLQRILGDDSGSSTPKQSAAVVDTPNVVDDDKMEI